MLTLSLSGKSTASRVLTFFEKLLELQAQASETSCATHMKKPPNRVTSFAANANSSGSNCVVCKAEKHPLYKFRSLSHDEKVSVLKTKSLLELPHQWALQATMQINTQVQGMAETASHSPAY